MSKQPRPEIAVNNPALYDYYANLPRNEEFMQKFHWLCSHVLHSQTIWAPDSRDAVGQHLHAGKPALLLLGHATWLDPAFDAGKIYEHEELHPIIGNNVIPANAPYFKKPFFGWLFDKGRAIPAFRPKDIPSDGESVNDQARETARITARNALARICIENIDNNSNVAIFFEGTRNRGDRQQVQPPKGTVMKIIEGVQRPNELMVIAMMPYYGNRKLKNLVRPTLAIDHVDPSETSGLDADAIKQFTQSTLDLAVVAYENRSHPGLFEKTLR